MLHEYPEDEARKIITDLEKFKEKPSYATPADNAPAEEKAAPDEPLRGDQDVSIE